MRLLDMIAGKDNKNRQQRPGFPSFVTPAHGDSDFSTPLLVGAKIGAVGVWARIWQTTVKAQTMLRWGFGVAAKPETMGYMWFYAGQIAGTGPGFHEGTLRLIIERANHVDPRVVAELADTQLHGGDPVTLLGARLLNRNQMIGLPEMVMHPFVGEDSVIALEYRPTSLTIGGSAIVTADFVIPVTGYYA